MKKKTDEPLRGICIDCTRARTCKEKNPVDDLGRNLRTIYCKNFRGNLSEAGKRRQKIQADAQIITDPDSPYLHVTCIKEGDEQ